MKIRVLVPMMALLMVACESVGPNYHRPELAAPKQWSVDSAKSMQTEQWWKIFNDAILNGLIKDAIAANLDLKQALVRIKDTRAQRSAIFAAALPSLTAKTNISRRLNNTSVGAQSGGAGGGFGVGNQLINIFQLGFDAQWELDFFGGARRAAEAADATLESDIESSRDVLVSLLAEVARNYIALRGQQKLQEITLKNLEAQQETEQLTEIRQQSGLSSSLDVVQAQALVATTLADVASSQTQIQQSIHTLSVLLGREPNALMSRLNHINVTHLTTSGQAATPMAGTTVIPDLPSELLKRRPDIRRAERLMASASANIGIATAELYPKINLLAFLGLQNSSIKDFTPLGKSWSTAASLTMPIFNWGQLKANIKSKQAQSELAFLTYQSTVLNAFKEVEDALVACTQEKQRYQALDQAVEANQLAVHLATERYETGLTGFIDVLNSQQSLYQTQAELTRSEADISTQLVALYKALGGGWQTEAKVNDTCARCQKNIAEQLYNLTKPKGGSNAK
ncbi:efflux transporter outer membrane subunit [Crenothrix sp.]|uniref:efflux transporter outer membrane subunit n=1 Tax=Crenothrix sp. TaxID=3100433 RepID=UPI00374CBF89